MIWQIMTMSDVRGVPQRKERPNGNWALPRRYQTSRHQIDCLSKLVRLLYSF
jgi:hypothetical protein